MVDETIAQTITTSTVGEAVGIKYLSTTLTTVYVELEANKPLTVIDILGAIAELAAKKVAEKEQSS